MQYTELGRTGIMVSRLCLGSMTWGTQNSEADGHAQMDLAVSEGINFIDTAELYPTNPISAETQGRTEAIIGNWFERTGRRGEIVLASKITGKGYQWIRGGVPLSSAEIERAVEASLRRLKTDYIDLYQLHWPNRSTYHFRGSWTYDPSDQNGDQIRAHMLDVLEAMQRLVEAGKIRAVGLSNETCWGAAEYLRIAEANGLPRAATIQNEYSLLHRLFDLDLAELVHNEEVGLLAFSPLAAGMLTGKYRNGAIPPGSRRSISEELSGRYTQTAATAVDAYCQVAERHDLEPAQMALAFCLTRPFMTAPIVGATSVDQLKTNIGALYVKLSDEVMAEIAEVHRRFPIPM